ncbi:hypothetical protein FQ320_22050 [Oceaniovalibus sp. ACAM 378]|jgi:hypothetical protein|nr:hypothetical protein [Oceaniovalibus sp. ACAM 378]TYB84449.1 hypothetical protein FQ320_22050 [Oceaniovalibus sp. ACAM 378]
MALMTVAAALALGAGPGWAQDGRLTVELNKVEPGDTGGCRAFFLFRNRTAQTLDGFEMSLAILNASGVIDQLLTIDAAPLPAGRTTLKLFEIPGASCDGISEILLHDIATCQAGGEDADCFAMVDLVSRADIGLTK